MGTGSGTLEPTLPPPLPGPTFPRNSYFSTAGLHLELGQFSFKLQWLTLSTDLCGIPWSGIPLWNTLWSTHVLRQRFQQEQLQPGLC